ncbi:hypothetical protein JG688_00013267 [Phytophthora aleatoria]|uniref:CCHC-type domain-containing protein n=1 Tax=Phytophthora aleatoria TaxID=2496075 RepID=A0A8J5M452_9STRA|nr:hypothetical protein JG688_00013267 [Phytophthora aleatoria]
MRDHFTSEIRAQEKTKRGKYTCGRCGEAQGHNAAKCPNRSKGNIDTDVQPVNYIVGGCPLILLQQQKSFVSREVEKPIFVCEYSL